MPGLSCEMDAPYPADGYTPNSLACTQKIAKFDPGERFAGVGFPVPTGVLNENLKDSFAFILLIGLRSDHLTHFDHGADAGEIVDEFSRCIAA